MDQDLQRRILNLLDEATSLLRSTIESVTLPIAVRTDAEVEERFVLAAVTLFSFGCYVAAETMRVLVRSSVTLQLPTLVRQQFEAAISAAYIVLVNRNKARDFILLDEFERYDLSREADLSSERRTKLEEDCRQTLQQFPELIARLKNGREIASGKLPIDDKVLREVRDKLAFPKVREMVRQLQKHDAGFTGKLYTISHRFGNLTAHPNIVSLRRIFEHWDYGQSASPKLDLMELGAPDFVLQGLNNVIGIGMMLDRVRGAVTDEKWEGVRISQESLASELRDLDRINDEKRPEGP